MKLYSRAIFFITAWVLFAMPASSFALGAYQRPAFDRFGLSLDFSPAVAPGYGSRFNRNGFTYREEEFLDRTYTSGGGALQMTFLKSVGLELGFDVDQKFEDDIVPRFGAALGHSFDDWDIGARLRIRVADDNLGSRYELNGFVVWQLEPEVGFEFAGGLSVVPIPGSVEGPDGRGDLWIHPRIMLQFTESFGVAAGPMLPIAGETEVNGRLGIESVYTIALGLVALDLSVLSAFENGAHANRVYLGTGAAIVY